MPARLATALADRYRIERELGQGGMATVYLAEDVKHKRRVAVKVLKPELAAVLGAERFVQEITTTASLQHPHILPLFDSGEADGFLFYVMPFIDGETLRSKLDRETQLAIDETIAITADVADALEYAHSQGVIHRDIKPENILLANGRPMVADFGIALAVSAAAGGRMTETGLSLGTPHYMSPEQATAEKEITARSDVYSLASVCYEMLAGEPPHLGGSAQQIIMKIIAEQAQPVTELRRSVPAHVAAALATALEKLPADRFPTARAFKDALRNPAYASAQGAAHATTGTSARNWLSDPRSLALIGVATVALAAVGWLASRPTPRAPTAYDVALPDSAGMWSPFDAGFIVAPSGRFAIYESHSAEGSSLWYRSLLDATTRRIEGTADGVLPALSPDEQQVAFLRELGGDWSVETVSLVGGATTVISRGSGAASQLTWLPDGRIRLLDDDAKRASWFNPGGGPEVSRPIEYCILAAPLADPDALLCGGGGEKTAYSIDTRVPRSQNPLRTSRADSGRVFGSHFRVIDGKYLIYISAGGDLLGAPVDLAAGFVGKSARLVTGVVRRGYSGAGAYDLTSTGTLVYAPGANEPVGSLVRAGLNGLDTLDVGRAPFLRWNLSPDGRRLAAVVEELAGDELRIYDLGTGRHIVFLRAGDIRQPVWSPTGDRLLFSANDTTYIGRPGQSAPPERVLEYPEGFEAYTWLLDGRVIGTLWGEYRAAVVNVNRRPAVLDSLRDDVTFIRASPDARWLAYSNRAITEIWLEPFPRDGRIFPVVSAGGGEPQWISATRLAALVITRTGARVEVFDINPSAASPLGRASASFDLPGFNDTPGQSFTVTPDGRALYVQGNTDRSSRYLRVIPGWVEQMKRAVDEANK